MRLGLKVGQIFYNENNKFYSTNNYVVSHGCDGFLRTTSKEDVNSKNELLFCCRWQVQWEIMKLKKKYPNKTSLLSCSSGLQRSTSAGCHLTRHFLSSAKVWPHCGAALGTRKGQSFSFPEMMSFSPGAVSLALCWRRASGSPAAMGAPGRFESLLCSHATPQK